MKTDMTDEILQTFALDWHQLMLKSEKHSPQPFEKLQAKATQAINELTLKQVLELIGESGLEMGGDDYQTGYIKGQQDLRAELRQSAERIWKI